jgi:arylsulfatase A-like enzyme
VLEARQNRKYAPLSVAVAALIRGQYKLMRFFGYNVLQGDERFELYDLKKDPEEFHNLLTEKRDTASTLLNELKAKLAEVDQPFL